MNNKIFLLGVGFNNLKKEEVLELIIKGLEKNDKKYYVVTPNPEILVIANSDSNYKKVLNSAKLALPDGIGVMLASKLLSKPFKERIQGVDLVESLCREVSKRPITVGFLGAGPHVAETAAECLREKYPGLNIVFTAEEWDWEADGQTHDAQDPRRSFPQSSKLPRSLNEIRPKKSMVDKNGGKPSFGSFANSLSLGKMENGKRKTENKIDILFVAFGSPKQEIWTSENLEKLPVKVAIGVGGSFDFISKKVPRAPRFLRDLGLEWLFRLIIQPWRIKRQLRLLKFIYLVIKEKLTK